MNHVESLSEELMITWFKLTRESIIQVNREKLESENVLVVNMRLIGL